MSDLDAPYKTSPDAYKTSPDAYKDSPDAKKTSPEAYGKISHGDHEKLQNEVRALFSTPQNAMAMFSSSFRTAVGAHGQIAVDITDPEEGGGTGNGIPAKLHNYTVSNASTGATPKIIVTPGNHFDSGAGATIIPTISGTPIFPLPSPMLTVGNTDTAVYFHGTASGGVTSAIEILSGTSVPVSSTTGGDWYQLCAFITVSIVSGVATVTSNEGGVSGSQDSQWCPSTPGWGFGLQ